MTSRPVMSCTAVLLACTVVLQLRSAAGAAGCRDGVDTQAFAGPGRYGVGLRTLALVDGSRDTPAYGANAARAGRQLTTEVWYPTAAAADVTPVRDAPAASGRFAVIVDAHGFGDFRESRAYYATVLASHGYVVAAPEFPITSTRSGAPNNLDTPNQPADVSFVVTSLLGLGRDPESWLAGRLDQRRIGVSGYSNGGTTALLVGFHADLHDARVRAVAAIAPGACYLTERFFFTASRPPLLVIAGGGDAVVQEQPRDVFHGARSPRTLVTLADAGHTGFLGFVTQPTDSSYDDIACSVLRTLPPDAFPLDPEALGGARAGIDPASCAIPCQDPLPPGRPMQGTRQHELTAAALTAFFDGTLGRSAGARCFLAHGLALENADVGVEHLPATQRPRPLAAGASASSGVQ